MLLAKGKITKEMIAMLSTWRHSGFHVFCGNRISPDEETAMEYLALHHPGVILPGKDAVHGSGGEGRLYIQRRQDRQELPRHGMTGQPVLPHPQPGRADGALLRTL